MTTYTERKAQLETKTNAAPQLRPFSQVDWYGFAGCLRWADDVQPHLAEVRIPGWPQEEPGVEDGQCLVVDSQGLELSGMYGAIAYHLDAQEFATPAAHRQVLLDLARMILAAPPAYTTLLALGFQEL